MDFELVKRFHLPRRVLEETREELRYWGDQSKEGRVLWIGRLRNREGFSIEEAMTPLQFNTAISTMVPGEEIIRIFSDIYERGLALAAQIHSHPKDAYHSEVDDANPIATQLGTLSVVVPDYASGSMKTLDECEVYRLEKDGWRSLRPDELRLLVRVHE